MSGNVVRKAHFAFRFIIGYHQHALLQNQILQELGCPTQICFLVIYQSLNSRFLLFAFWMNERTGQGDGVSSHVFKLFFKLYFFWYIKHIIITFYIFTGNEFCGISVEIIHRPWQQFLFQTTQTFKKIRLIAPLFALDYYFARKRQNTLNNI